MLPTRIISIGIRVMVLPRKVVHIYNMPIGERAKRFPS